MKKIVSPIAICLLAFSSVIAQNDSKQQKPKKTESNEIAADKHLEKEMQQKQLSSKPERLNEAKAAATYKVRATRKIKSGNHTKQNSKKNSF